MKKLIVYYNPNKDIYYYKIIYDFLDKYYVGYCNQYKHLVVLVVDNINFYKIKEPLKKRIITNIIRYLENKIKI